ncbi:MAG: hypothetical protein Q8P25_03265 [Candidatus Curtissbacteria bacterium]|nr:hypothetical protein [Candidatus Curtissbacteria bacterium]
MDKKTGWSIAVNGSFVAELEKYLVVAIAKVFHCWGGKWWKKRFTALKTLLKGWSN